MGKGDLAAVRGTPGAVRVRKSDHMLSVPPWRSFTLLQLVDVQEQDTKLKTLLRRTKSTTACHPKTGWMSADSWQRVHTCMEQRLRDVVGSVIASPLRATTPQHTSSHSKIPLTNTPTHHANSAVTPVSKSPATSHDPNSPATPTPLKKNKNTTTQHTHTDVSPDSKTFSPARLPATLPNPQSPTQTHSPATPASIKKTIQSPSKKRSPRDSVEEVDDVGNSCMCIYVYVYTYT